MSLLADFHFLRPWWLIAVLPTVVAWYVLRRHRNKSCIWESIVAPHLLPHLLKTNNKGGSNLPMNLATIASCTCAFAASGPTWYRAPTPFADDVAALAIVIKVTPSMLTEDVQPSRLARSVEKIHDLLKLRGSSKTCLVAYSGTAHVVMPLTTDSNIIDTFSQSLDPKIMPVEGDLLTEALSLADKTIADLGGGSIWLIADDIPESEIVPLQRLLDSSRSRVSILPALAAGQEADKTIRQAKDLSMQVVPMSADDSDVQQLARISKIRPVLSDDEQGRWVDSGYWLTPIIAIMMLPLFRRGTSVLGPTE